MLEHPMTPSVSLSGCGRETLRAPQPCTALPGILCAESGNRTFHRDVPCEWTNGYEFDTALGRKAG